jgi:glucose/arabinose dehydrogenase
MSKPSMNRMLPAVLPMLVASIAGCGGDGSNVPGPSPVAPVASVTVTAPATTVPVGGTVQLTATAKDANGTVLEGRAFEWATSDASVASVSPTGLVTALAEGPVEIRVTAEGIAGNLGLTVMPAGPVGPVSLGLQEVVSGLDFPLYLTSPPGDDRLFVVLKGGTIRVIKGGVLQAAPFLDLTAKVNSTGGERGLLGLAFAPDYATSGRFIVHYSELSGDTHVSLFQVSADPDRADPASESVLLTVPQPGVAHKSGQVLFGPDRFLYIGVGDGDDDDHGQGQSLGDLLGSILRVDVTSGAAYTVPPDNPFVGNSNARPEVWSYGFRNPWRFTFDRATGDLYIGEVGDHNWEEIDFASAGDGAGRGINYGWGSMEGKHCVRAACDQSGLTLPVLEYDHTNGCSVIGGYVYRGAAIPGLQGTYFYADYCGGWVKSFRMQGGQVVDQKDWPELAPGGKVTSFGEDAAGELYVVSQAGGVFKIVPK